MGIGVVLQHFNLKRKHFVVENMIFDIAHLDKTESRHNET